MEEKEIEPELVSSLEGGGLVVFACSGCEAGPGFGEVAAELMVGSDLCGARSWISDE